MLARTFCRLSNITVISVISALLAAAVGVSYVYVDLSLNRMGVSGVGIGLNAAMPALGWLLMTPLMPWALRRLEPRLILPGLLAVAMAALPGFQMTSDQGAWLIFRFLFGGSCGMAFRVIEYWISAASPDDCRTRNIAIYSACFCAGAAIGAGGAPLAGLQGWSPIMLMLVLTGICAVIFILWPAAPMAVTGIPGRRLGSLRGAALVGVAGSLIYGMFEPVPYTLMPVYAVRGGLTEQWAALTASAFLSGQVVLLVPLGILADRMGKIPLLVACASVALAVTFVVPLARETPELLLAAMFVWGGVGGALYAVTLALLADYFDGSDLAAANAAFGVLYAFGALTGAPLHGVAMDLAGSDGLMISSAALFAAFLVLVFWRAAPAWRRA